MSKLFDLEEGSEQGTTKMHVHMAVASKSDGPRTAINADRVCMTSAINRIRARRMAPRSRTATWNRSECVDTRRHKADT